LAPLEFQRHFRRDRQQPIICRHVREPLRFGTRTRGQRRVRGGSQYENDEIRFGNNENFTYRVLEVFAPQENVSSSAEGDFAKVKLKLDKPVDTSINKDFFLVRRKVVNPNSLYLDTPFPYGILSSGSISQVIMNTGSNSFALSGSVDANGLYTASISNLELATTPGILFPDFPTEYLTKSASMIVNDLISKGVIES